MGWGDDLIIAIGRHWHDMIIAFGGGGGSCGQLLSGRDREGDYENRN